MHSDCLEESDLEDYLIGDSAGRELLVALEHRCLCNAKWTVLGFMFQIELILLLKFYRLIMHSDCLEELDLEDNLIGYPASRELLVALEHRWLFNTG